MEDYFYESIKKYFNGKRNGTGEPVDAGLPKHGRYSVKTKKIVCRNNRTDARSRDGGPSRTRTADHPVMSRMQPARRRLHNRLRDYYAFPQTRTITRFILYSNLLIVKILLVKTPIQLALCLPFCLP